MDEKQSKQLECLLADYNAIKFEIGRRSNLQRIVFASYATVFVLIFQKASSDTMTAFHVTGLWIAGAMALLFYVREHFEIKRLGELIKKEIAPQVAKILDTEPEHLFPSETIKVRHDVNQEIHLFNTLFLWLSFFVFPLLLTFFELTQQWSYLGELINSRSYLPWLAFITILASSGIIYLLVQVAWPLRRKTGATNLLSGQERHR